LNDLSAVDLLTLVRATWRVLAWSLPANPPRIWRYGSTARRLSIGVGADDKFVISGCERHPAIHASAQGMDPAGKQAFLTLDFFLVKYDLHQIQLYD